MAGENEIGDAVVVQIATCDVAVGVYLGWEMRLSPRSKGLIISSKQNDWGGSPSFAERTVNDVEMAVSVSIAECKTVAPLP
jgi:hypothetical protein